MEPKGRGGWLAVLLFSLIFSTLYVISGNLVPIAEAEQRGVVWPNGFKPVFYLSVLLSAGVIATAAWMLIKHDEWYSVNIAIRCMWIGALASIFVPAFVLARYIPGTDVSGEVVRGTFSSLFWLIVWTLYLLKSKRVRNTYSKGAPYLYSGSSRAESSTQNIVESQQAPEETEKASPVQPPTSAQVSPALAQEAQPHRAAVTLKFTMFRADADGKWYWVLQETVEGRTICRSSGKASRSECLKDIGLLRTGATDATIWDKTANEFVMGQ